MDFQALDLTQEIDLSSVENAIEGWRPMFAEREIDLIAWIEVVVLTPRLNFAEIGTNTTNDHGRRLWRLMSYR